jgi:hypothetical protein
MMAQKQSELFRDQERPHPRLTREGAGTKHARISYCPEKNAAGLERSRLASARM